jgi:predicted permease
MDFRYALRMLLTRPGFTAIALISLALGIGANTAVFSLVNQVLLKPLPIDHPEQVYSLCDTGPTSGDFSAFSYPDYRDLREHTDVFSGLLAFRFAPINLSHSGDSSRIWGYIVSGNYFDVLGVKPHLGRTFAPDEDSVPGAHPVAVLSYGCWQRRFASDPDIAGKTISLNDNSFTVIGVAPAGFNGTELAFTPELYVPAMMSGQIEPGSNWLTERNEGVLLLVGRIPPSLSKQQAEAGLRPATDALNDLHGQTKKAIGTLSLYPPGLFTPSLRGPIIGFALFLMAVVSLVLLIACSNLASLLLARATERHKEIAVRMAIGAGRLRLLRQLLTESIFLSLLGGAAGLVLSFWLIRLIAAFRPPIDFALTFDLHLDGRVLLFSLVVSILTGVIFGLAPALQSTKLDLVSSLKEEARGGSSAGSRLQDLLVVGQVALSLVLLVGTGLVVRSLQQARSIDPGFDPTGAVEVSFDVGLQRYDQARGLAFYERALERVQALPGTRAASLASIMPLALNRSTCTIFVEGHAPPSGRANYDSLQNHIWAGYFKAMGIPLLDGRDFSTQDNKNNSEVAIVNETFARNYLGGNALGRRISRSSANGPFIQIVGVAKDGKYLSIGESPRPMIYFPLLQSYESSVTLVARTGQDPRSAIAAIRSEIRQLDPTLPLYDAETVSEQLGLVFFPARLAAVMLGAFGFLALVLAAVGIYGIVSFASRRRIREIGIRVALGATRSRVVLLVIRRALTLVSIGLALGLAGAFALTRFLSGILYGVSATDSIAFLSVGFVLAFVALAASWIPARLAAGADPISSLRYE